jgi:hypothetical protein
MSRGTIGITLALLVTEHHRQIGTLVEGDDLGFRCPRCGEPLKACASVPDDPRGHFQHIGATSACQWAQGGRLLYALRSDVLARYPLRTS